MAQVVRRMVRIRMMRERRRIRMVRIVEVVGDFGVGRRDMVGWVGLGWWSLIEW